MRNPGCLRSVGDNKVGDGLMHKWKISLSYSCDILNRFFLFFSPCFCFFSLSFISPHFSSSPHHPFFFFFFNHSHSSSCWFCFSSSSLCLLFCPCLTSPTLPPLSLLCFLWAARWSLCGLFLGLVATDIVGIPAGLEKGGRESCCWDVSLFSSPSAAPRTAGSTAFYNTV